MIKITEETDFSQPYAKPVFLEGGDHAVLLIHGFTACPSQLYPLAKKLNERGYTVKTILLPGHGADYASMARSNRRVWLETALSEAKALRKKYPYLTVGGLSMGGDLSLLVASEICLESIVIMSAPMAVRSKAARYARLLSVMVPSIHVQPHDRNIPEEYVPYDLQYKVDPTSKINDLNAIIAAARKKLPKITCPAVCFQSEADPTVSHDSLDIIFEQIGSERKQKIRLKEPGHIITLGPELDMITDTIDTFIRVLPDQRKTTE